MEMLLVLTIISLLVALAMFHLGNIAGTADEKKVDADIAGFKELLAAYQLETGSLPTTEQGLKALVTKPTVEPIPQHWRAMLDQETLDPWGHPYQYRNPGKHNPDKYDVYSMGPDGQPDNEDDIGNWTTTSTSSN
jgi:general secretion pathway protein G